MRLSRQAASARTKKGWATKRAKYGRRTWKRPTGEKVKLRGFNYQEAHDLKRLLVQYDQALPHTKVNVGAIKKQRLPNSIQRQYKGDAVGYTYHSHAEYLGIVRPKTRAGRAFAQGYSRVALHQKPYSYIALEPKVVTQGSKKYGGVLTHELGHGIDYGYQHSLSPEWKQAAKWQSPKTKAKHYRGGGYQKTSPSEDFAESFRKSMGYSKYPYHRVVVDNPRQQYLQKRVFK